MNITLKNIKDAFDKVDVKDLVEPLGNGLFKVDGNIICDETFLKDIDSAIKIDIDKCLKYASKGKI